MELSILQWLFQGIPECLALAALAMVLAGRRLEAKSVFLIGLPHAVITYLVRLLPLTFGVHFIIFVVVLATLLNVWLKISLSRGLLTALTGLIILAVAEVSFISIILLAMGISFEQASQNIFLLIVYGWPHAVLLFLLAVAIDRWRKRRRVKEGFDA